MTEQITDAEREMMKDAYRYLSRHIAPPAGNDSDAYLWWKAAAREAYELVTGKWHNHPLITQVMPGIYGYIEHKAKEAAAHVESI